jgi:hypothetical protein
MDDEVVPIPVKGDAMRPSRMNPLLQGLCAMNKKAPPEGEALSGCSAAYRNTNLAMKIAVSTHRLAEISLKRPVPALSTT